MLNVRVEKCENSQRVAKCSSQERLAACGSTRVVTFRHCITNARFWIPLDDVDAVPGSGRTLRTADGDCLDKEGVFDEPPPNSQQASADGAVWFGNCTQCQGVQTTYVKLVQCADPEAFGRMTRQRWDSIPLGGNVVRGLDGVCWNFVEFSETNPGGENVIPFGSHFGSCNDCLNPSGEWARLRSCNDPNVIRSATKLDYQGVPGAGDVVKVNGVCWKFLFFTSDFLGAFIDLSSAAKFATCSDCETGTEPGPTRHIDPGSQPGFVVDPGVAEHMANDPMRRCRGCGG